VNLFAVELPTAGVARGGARQLSQFSYKRFTISSTCELFQVFPHKLIDTFPHSPGSLPSFLDDLVVN
jgi:hypothetical protein